METIKRDKCVLTGIDDLEEATHSKTFPYSVVVLTLNQRMCCVICPGVSLSHLGLFS